MAPDASSRPLRRDAERNRVRILEAARELFAERGLEVTLDDVAHRAGVGVGTVYRRFPDKEQLIDALFEERLTELAAIGEQALALDDPLAALRSFLEQMIELQAHDRGLKEIAVGGPHGSVRVARARESIYPVVVELTRRAMDAGALRPDADATDIPFVQMMLGGVTDVAGDADPGLWRRYLQILLDGLSAQAAGLEPLHPPLQPEQLVEAVRRWRPPRRR